jgi:hypothetical protein
MGQSSTRQVLSGIRSRTGWIATAMAVGLLGAVACAQNLGSQTAQVQQRSPTPSSAAELPIGEPSQSPSTPAQHPSASASPSPAPAPSAAPTRGPLPPPSPLAPLCGAPSNPWGYNFCGGTLIVRPPLNFCQYFNCTASFWQSPKGYVDQCNDGAFSHTGGGLGACSLHGGERRPLFSPG